VLKTRLHINGNERCLLHPKTNRLDWIGQIQREMLRSIAFDQDRCNVQAIAFRRPRFGIRVDQRRDYVQGALIALYGMRWSNLHNQRRQIDGFGIDRVVLGMVANKSDVAHADSVGERDDPPKGVSFDIEHHTVAPDETRRRIAVLDFLRGTPHDPGRFRMPRQKEVSCVRMGRTKRRKIFVATIRMRLVSPVFGLTQLSMGFLEGESRAPDAQQIAVDSENGRHAEAARRDKRACTLY
jgi:hypothetical protein